MATVYIYGTLDSIGPGGAIQAADATHHANYWTNIGHTTPLSPARALTANDDIYLLVDCYIPNVSRLIGKSLTMATLYLTAGAQLWLAGAFTSCIVDFSSVDDPTADMQVEINRDPILVSAAGRTFNDFPSTATVLDGITYANGNLVGTADVPVTLTSTLSLVRGDDYLNADGRALGFTCAGPSISGGTVLLAAKSRYTNIIGMSIGGIVTSGTSGYFEVTSAVTSLLEPGASAYNYDIQATLSSGHIITIQTGTVQVTPDVIPGTEP